PLWRPAELQPYRALMNVRGAVPDAVMVGHLYHEDFSERTTRGVPLPATLSPAAIRGLLRRKVGYTGVAMTDDLEMDGVRRGRTRIQVARAAVAAGNDLLLFNNSRPYRVDLAQRLHAVLMNDLARACPRLSPECTPVRRILASAARIKAVRGAKAAGRRGRPSICPVRTLRTTCK
ncbi:MAG: glycoside hydrolase family 3 N-terminal domain-containing protein, partial [Pseudomonadota bacterium]